MPKERSNVRIDYVTDGEHYQDCDDCGIKGCEKCEGGLIYLPFICLVGCREGFRTEREQLDHLMVKHRLMLPPGFDHNTVM